MSEYLTDFVVFFNSFFELYLNTAELRLDRTWLIWTQLFGCNTLIAISNEFWNIRKMKSLQWSDIKRSTKDKIINFTIEMTTVTNLFL